jgi:exodeoxyribonuclease VII large subunit
MAVPVRSELIAVTRDRGARLGGAWARAIERLKSELRGLARGIPSLDGILALPRQRLDAAGERLPRALRANAHAHRVELSKLAAKHTPHALRARLERYRERTDTLAGRAYRARGNALKNARMRLDGLSQLLRSFSHKSVLDRGFALVRGPDGHPVRSVAAARAGTLLDIEVADGRFGAAVTGTPPKKAEPAPVKPVKQGNLFG